VRGSGPAVDVVVAGGGSAGCVVAARLSEDPGCRVLLLERGPDPRPLPETLARAERRLLVYTETPYVRAYEARRSVDRTVFHLLAGHILGGGSTINVMAANRATPADFAAWGREVDPLWAWDRVLPVFRRIEHDADFADTGWHGGHGPLWIQRRARPAQFTGWPAALRDACVELGYPVLDDLNGPDPYGVSAFPWTIRDGRRQSAVVAYLDAARARPNLTIVDGATVTRVELDGPRVAGVRYVREGREERVGAGEVVLSAGVYHSPQVLMLSGIGPPEELRRHGIPVRVAAPAVGENLQDHAAVFPVFEWHHRDPVEWPGVCPILLAKSDPARPVIDLHLIPRGPITIPGAPAVAPVAVYLLEQRNRGRLTLASPDPLALPVIEPRMLEDDRDAAAIVAGMRLARRLTGAGALKGYYGDQVDPEPGDDWTGYARRTYDSYHHGAGTCRMARDGAPAGVVDARLKVRGVRGLRVADASVMPTVVRGNTNLTTLMIGERCADFIREGG
jgi:choline dehydrogenase